MKPESEFPEIETWATDLKAEVVAPIEASRAAAIAAGSAAAVGVGTAASGLAAATALKVAAIATAAVLVGGAIGAVAGVLPDAIQSWVADLVDGLGISLPRPEDVLPTVPTTLPGPPDLTVPDVTVP